MKKVMLIAVVAMFFGLMTTSCTQTPPASPKTSIIVITTGGGNDTTKTVSTSYGKTKTDSLGVVRNYGKTTTTSVAKKAPGEIKLIVTETPQVQQPPIQQTQPQPVVTNSSTYIPWVPIGIVLLALVLLGLIVYLLRRPTSNIFTSVRIYEGETIEQATRRTIAQGERAFRDRALKVIEDGAAGDKLSDFSIEEDLESFKTNVKYKS